MEQQLCGQKTEHPKSLKEQKALVSGVKRIFLFRLHCYKVNTYF